MVNYNIDMWFKLLTSLTKEKIQTNTLQNSFIFAFI